MGVRDIAKKIAASRAAGGGNYLKDGKGICIVKALKQENLYKGETFIAELLVETSESIPGLMENGQPVTANSPGSTFAFIQQFEEFPDVAFGNTKAFILTLMGESDESLVAAAAEIKASRQKAGTLAKGEDYTADDEFAAAYERLTGPQQPGRGMRISFETYRRVTKKSGKSLVLPHWEHVPQTVEQIAATRAKLDGAA